MASAAPAAPDGARRARPAGHPLLISVKTASAFDDAGAIERTLQASEAGFRRCMTGRALPSVFAVAFKVAPLDGKPTGGIESTWPNDLQQGAAVRCFSELMRQLSFGPAAREVNRAYTAVLVEIATGDAARPPSPLERRLLAQSRAGLGNKLVSDCARGGTMLPSSVTFEVRVDKLGRVFDAELVKPADLDTQSEACFRRWMKNWRFLAGDGETRGQLDVALPRR